MKEKDGLSFILAKNSRRRHQPRRGGSSPEARLPPSVAQHPFSLGPEGLEGEGEHHVMDHIRAIRVPHADLAHVAAVGDARCVERRGLAGLPR
jgi:hypothetical protein